MPAGINNQPHIDSSEMIQRRISPELPGFRRFQGFSVAPL
jgi:hypothetical protein